MTEILRNRNIFHSILIIQIFLELEKKDEIHKDKDGQSTSGQMRKNSDKGPESGNEYSFFCIRELVIMM